MNFLLLNTEVQQFIKENLNADISKILLKKSPFENILSAELAEQISAKSKCKSKLPLWFSTDGIYFAPKLSIEQASSEATALYKSTLVQGRLLDMTGGFGVDDYYFSKVCKELIYCELNEELTKIVSHNFSVLHTENVTCICKNSLEYLSENPNEKFDIIYLDPARRDTNQQKIFLLKDCQPDVPQHLEFLWNFTDTILIKTSPMLDIDLGIKELSQVAEIHIIAVQNEVKELLFLLKKNTSSLSISVKTINIQNAENQEFKFIFSEKNTALVAYAPPLQYLYEPNAAIMKSGGYSVLGQKLNLKKLGQHSHLFTCETLIPDFQGRIFKIDAVEKFQKSIMKNIENQQYNITTRNFGMSVSEIRKKFKIKDGGEKYLFFTTDFNSQKIVIFCTKIQL